MNHYGLMVVAALAGCFMAAPANAVSFTTTTGPFTSEAGAVTFQDFDGGAIPGVATFAGGCSNCGSSPGSGNWSAANSFLEVTFNAPTQYVGFYWGTLDNDNSVQLYNGATLLAQYVGTAINGQGSTFFVNFFAGAGEAITRVFLTSGVQFETDNFAYVATAETPLPAALPLFASILGGAGFCAWRRKRKAKAAVAA
jgi:hypothetical protein